MPEETKISEFELDQLQRIEDKIARVTATLIRVMPDTKREVLATVAASLCDFWQIADNHRIRMWELLKLDGPQDKQKLQQLISELVHDDIKAHLPNHVESVEQVLPALIEILETEKK
jgi:hypothetical protein